MVQSPSQHIAKYGSDGGLTTTADIDRSWLLFALVLCRAVRAGAHGRCRWRVVNKSQDVQMPAAEPGQQGVLLMETGRVGDQTARFVDNQHPMIGMDNRDA